MDPEELYQYYDPPGEPEYQAHGGWNQNDYWMQPEVQSEWSSRCQEEPSWGYCNQGDQSNWSSVYQPNWSSGNPSNLEDSYIPPHQWGYQGDQFNPQHDQQWNQGPSYKYHANPGPQGNFHPDQWPGYDHYQGIDSSQPYPKSSTHIDDLLGDFLNSQQHLQNNMMSNHEVVHRMQDAQQEQRASMDMIYEQMSQIATSLSEMRARREEKDELIQEDGQARMELVDMESLHSHDIVAPLVQEYLEEEPIQEHFAKPNLGESIEEEAAGWCEALRVQQMEDEEISSLIMEFCEQSHPGGPSRSAQLVSVETLPDLGDVCTRVMDPNLLPSGVPPPQQEPEEEEIKMGDEELLAHTEVRVDEEEIVEPTEEVDDSDEEPPKGVADEEDSGRGRHPMGRMVEITPSDEEGDQSALIKKPIWMDLTEWSVKLEGYNELQASWHYITHNCAPAYTATQSRGINNEDPVPRLAREILDYDLLGQVKTSATIAQAGHASATHPVFHQNVCRLLGEVIRKYLNNLVEDVLPPKCPAPEVLDIPLHGKSAAGRIMNRKLDLWPNLIKYKDPSDHHLRPLEKRKIKGTFKNHKKKRANP